MSNQPESNVFLLPATIDYYQMQLTRMLETERYREAAATLRFLLGCRVEESNRQEWQALYDWLQQALSDGSLQERRTIGDSAEPAVNEDGEDGEEPSEAEMAASTVRGKAANRSYVRSLLDTLRGDASEDKQLLAIEQLAHLDDAEITPALLEWLRRAPHHPLLQYRVLAALKRRGETGDIVIPRVAGGRTELLALRIEDTPLGADEHPPAIAAVPDRVRAAGDEPFGPMLGEYAETVWNDYVQSVYGTSRYRQLAELDDAGIDAWAAALHAACGAAFGQSDEEGEARAEEFGVTGELRELYRAALEELRAFMPIGSL